MSPNRSNDRPHELGRGIEWPSASNATHSTVVAPATRSSLAGAGERFRVAPGEDHGAAPARDRACAPWPSAMSEPPPRMSTDCTEPRASFIEMSLSESEPAGEVGGDHAARGRAGPGSLSTRASRGYMRAEVLRAGAGILGEVHPARRPGAPSRRTGRRCGRALGVAHRECRPRGSSPASGTRAFPGSPRRTA